MTLIFRAITVLFLIFFVNYGNIFAHPHVFISEQVNVVFDDNGLAGFRIEWTFDDMFAAMIAEDYDKNKNWRFEAEEIDIVKKEAFSYIAKYGYFTFIKIDGTPFEVKFIRDFHAELLEDRKMRYRFFIPCHVSAIKTPKHIIMAVYDPSYYSAILFEGNPPVNFENNNTYQVDHRIGKDMSTAIYYDQVHPYALFLSFHKKS